MTGELGRIEKPEAGQFAGKRKLLLVPLLYSWKDAPAEYGIMFDIYWQQVGEHVANLEAKLGAVARIYHESVGVAGEEGLRLLEELSPSTFKLVGEKSRAGAQIEATEDSELVEEAVDWERHLMMGFISQKVARVVSESFAETSKKRYEHIAKRIAETFKANEVAVLFIREGHRIQFPADIEVFSVFPPALNDIQRWMRDYSPEEKPGETNR